MSAGNEPRNQHVVTESYLRKFAIDGNLRRWEKTTGIVKKRGVRQSCANPFFNTVHTDDGRDHSLEHFWGDIETQVMPLLKKLLNGERSNTNRQAVKTFAALHLARSYTVQEITDKVFERHMIDRATRIEQDDEWHQRFEQQFGRSPEPGERYEFALSIFQADFQSNESKVELMAEQYDKFTDWLSPLHVQIVQSNNTVPAIGFATSDNPVAVWNDHNLSIRIGLGLSTREAEHIMLPLSPTTAAMFTTRPTADTPIAPWILQYLNHFTWRNAHTFVFFHPAYDAARSVPVGKLTQEMG